MKEWSNVQFLISMAVNDITFIFNGFAHTKDCKI